MYSRWDRDRLGFTDGHFDFDPEGWPSGGKPRGQTEDNLGFDAESYLVSVKILEALKQIAGPLHHMAT